MSILQKPHNILRAVSIGVLFGVAFLSPWLWWAALCGGVWFVLFAAQLQSAKQAWWNGWLLGTAKMLLVLSWGWYIFPVDWMGFSNVGVELLLIFSLWVLSAMALGLGYGLALLLLWKLWRCKYHVVWVVAIVVFFLADVVGSFIFSVVLSGPGSSFNIQYANGWMGFALAEHDFLLTSAQYGGVYILSIIFGLLVSIFGFCYQSRWYGWCLLALVVLFLTSGLEVLSYQTNEEITVAAVHTAFSREPYMTEAMRQERYDSYREVLEALSAQPADYILLPEDARFARKVDVPGNFLLHLQQKLDFDTVFIDTARFDRSVTTLRSYIYDTTTKEVYQFDKGYLVPQGEYVPYIYRLVATLFGGNAQLMNVLSDMNYQPGIDQRSVVLPTHVPAVLFCFESIDPRGVRRVIKERSEVPFVAHVISHAWFQRPPRILWHQLDSMLRVQAVWAGVPIIQAANQAPNKIYLPDGTSRVLPADISGDKWTVSYTSI